MSEVIDIFVHIQKKLSIKNQNSKNFTPSINYFKQMESINEFRFWALISVSTTL